MYTYILYMYILINHDELFEPFLQIVNQNFFLMGNLPIYEFTLTSNDQK